MNETATEYSFVCHKYGDEGHDTHRWEKKGADPERKARQAVIDANHRAEMSGVGGFYRGEEPYRVQVREVSGWADE